MDLEERTKNTNHEFLRLKNAYQKLQDCNLDLEVEHFNALQDLTILETQLYKFQNEFRNAEEAKNAAKSELKHLRRQNRYYEQVVDCFKHEMAVMSEQLVHLHEMLNLSNKSCREENGQLYNAVVDLQKLAERLQTDLVTTEKKVLIENQKNQMKDAKIGELQQIIGQKNADLNVHDEAINEMKLRLENALLENHELQGTIVALNSSIMQLELRLQNSNAEKAQKILKSKAITCKKSYSDCTDSCERKNRRAESSDQRGIITSLQRELEKVREKNKEKIRNLKRQNEDLKDKLATSELAAERLCAQICQLKEKLANVNETDCCREQELMQSKQIIIELRQTLIELNESLAESDLDVTLPEEYQRSRRHDSESGGEDIYQSCRCEIAQYKKLADRLKNTILNMKNKLKDLEFKNKTMRDELKGKDTKVNDMHKKASKKEKEWCQCIEELNEKLRESQEEEKRLTAFIDNLKVEVQKRIEEKKDMQQQEWLDCNCTSNDIASTQQEINCLKVEIKNMIQNQIALNKENDRLLKQVTYLQTRITELEEKNMQLKQKVEKLHSENKSYKEKNKNLTRDKDTLNHTVKCLEVELCEIKNIRDDLCAESKCVVNNVKAWLEEQRKVNEKVRKKTQCYCNTINKLKQENETLMIGRPLANSTAVSNNKPRYEKNFKYEQNCWCLDSQGSGSGMNSPRDSPTCSCSVEEWYSPTFKDEDETDEEDNFIHALEAITEEIRKNNRKWKGRCQDCPDDGQ